ncbi:MAG TPA: hypothetical protein VFV38_09550 [Ktedonobacteraceae bacterium]|nr:hypothetical protein [Ktedonobacteraceae bacterium]
MHDYLFPLDLPCWPLVQRDRLLQSAVDYSQHTPHIVLTGLSARAQSMNAPDRNHWTNYP